MKTGGFMRFLAAGLPVMLFLASGVCAQQAPKTSLHHHYKLIDLGTFGGPFALVNSEPTEQFINATGTIVGGADTALPTPAPGCYNPVNGPDCFISHAFAWRNGHLKDLGTLPGGSFSYAEGINDFGQIVGLSETGQSDPGTGFPQFHAVLWTYGGIRDLGTLGGVSSFATSINDWGQAMGVASNNIPDPFSILGTGGFNSPTQTRGFVWQNGHMRDLGDLGGPDTFAIFQNQRGQIAGMSFTSYLADPNSGVPPMDPFLWENGKMKDLGNFGGTSPIGLFSGWVAGLNNLGQVAGTLTLPGDQNPHGFFWNGQKLSDIGTLGGTFTVAYGLNDLGQVLGFSAMPGDNVFHAFLWQNGKMTDLGTVDNDPCSTSQYANLVGQVVGSSQASDGMGGCVNPFTHAFLWEHGGPSVDLNQLTLNSPLELTAASFISDSGVIVAGGDPAGCTNNDVCNHVALLIPCDENHPNIEGCDYGLVESPADVAASDVLLAAEKPSTVGGTTGTLSRLAATPSLRGPNTLKRIGASAAQ